MKCVSFKPAGTHANIHHEKYAHILSDMESPEEELMIEFHALPIPFANSIRRILISEVPTLALDIVKITALTSPLHEEQLAHRLGLVPIVTPPESLFSEKAKTNAKEAEFTLLVEATNGPCAVYTKDLQGTNGFQTAHQKILLTKLPEEGKVELDASARWGIGRDHAKFSPVATAYYRLLPDITIQGKWSKKEIKKVVDICPMGVFDIENGHLSLAHPNRCSHCRACQSYPYAEERITLGRKSNSIHFCMETTGSLSAKHALHCSLTILSEKASLWLSLLADHEVK